MTETDNDEDEVAAMLSKMLRKQLWVYLTKAAAPINVIRSHLKAHLEHQVRLEKRGIMFGAGPFKDANGDSVGIGLIIIRASSYEEAKRIAASDPMHIAGVRTYELYEWSLNEGHLNLSIHFSDRSWRLS